MEVSGQVLFDRPGTWGGDPIVLRHRVPLPDRVDLSPGMVSIYSQKGEPLDLTLMLDPLYTTPPPPPLARSGTSQLDPLQSKSWGSGRDSTYSSNASDFQYLR